MSWILLLFACAPDAAPPAHLARQERLVAAWPQAPAEVEAELRAVADPLERLTLVVAVSEAWPGTTGALCPILEAADRERCLTLNERPHLHQPAVGRKGAPPPPERSDPGGLVDRLADAGPLGPSPEGSPTVPACAGSADPRGCRQEAAARATPAQAVAICEAEGEPRWRDECVFRAAELPLIEATSPSAPPTVADGDALERASERAGALCLAAGAFRTQCLQHVGGRLGSVAPRTGLRGDPGWARLARAVQACAEAVERHAAPSSGPGLGDVVADKLWATSLWMAVDRGAVAAGAAAADLPPQALPHLRCALAERLVLDGGLSDEPLARAQAALAEAWERQDQGGRPGRLRFEAPSTWSPLAPALPELPRVHYLADPVRLWSQDPVVDARICLVEAGIRASPPRRDWLEELARSPDPAASATVARLSRAVLPSEILSDPPRPAALPPPRRPRGRSP